MVDEEEKYVSIRMIEDLASTIPSSNMTQIARTYLKLDIDLIDSLRDEAKDNNWRFNVEVLNEFTKSDDNSRLVRMIKCYFLALFDF